MELAPSITVLATGRPTPVAPGVWRMAWRIQNVGDAALDITETWLPHGRFRAERQSPEPPLHVAPTESVDLAFDVACHEEPGTVVENTFLILAVTCAAQPWRLLTRITVVWSRAGEPEARTELITVQRVGFSSQELL